MEPRMRTEAEKNAGQSDLDKALDEQLGKQGDDPGASTPNVSMGEQPKAEPEKQAEAQPEVEQRKISPPVKQGDTMDPYYLVSDVDGVNTSVMKLGEVGCLVRTMTPGKASVSETFIPGVTFGACHDSKGQLDGTHEIYALGNRVMHLSPPEVRKAGTPRAGYNISS